MPGTCADHGPAGSGIRLPSRYRIRASTTLGTSRAPARSRSRDGLGQDLAGVQAGQFGAAQGAPQPPGLVARLAAVFGGQGGQEQVAVALLAGGGGLGGPDRVQHGQVVGVGESLLAGLGSRELLAVAVQHAGQHAQRRTRRGRPGGRGTNAVSFGMNLVVAGQLGRRPRAGHRVSPLRGHGEHVREVGVGAAGQRDVGVLAVLGPGDHRQAGVHGPALRDMIGDRVPEFGIAVM